MGTCLKAGVFPLAGRTWCSPGAQQKQDIGTVNWKMMKEMQGELRGGWQGSFLCPVPAHPRGWVLRESRSVSDLFIVHALNRSKSEEAVVAFAGRQSWMGEPFSARSVDESVQGQE